MKIRKIISGGQTGVDRAALDVAMRHGIDHGGWIPKGRRTENGTLPEKYQLDEMSTTSYPKRTEKNILESDGTLIVSYGKLTSGSALTRKLAKKHGRPWLHIDLCRIQRMDAVRIVKRWLERNEIEVLNVAGPRASKDAAIYNEMVQLLSAVLGVYTPVDPIPSYITEAPWLFYPAYEDLKVDGLWACS